MLATCEALQLEVIPLVQTFGHMEFVLKLEQFQHLRDVPEMPESICPCHNQTMAVIRDIIDQVDISNNHQSDAQLGCVLDC